MHAEPVPALGDAVDREFALAGDERAQGAFLAVLEQSNLLGLCIGEILHLVVIILEVLVRLFEFIELVLEFEKVRMIADVLS